MTTQTFSIKTRKNLAVISKDSTIFGNRLLWPDDREAQLMLHVPAQTHIRLFSQHDNRVFVLKKMTAFIDEKGWLCFFADCGCH